MGRALMIPDFKANKSHRKFNGPIPVPGDLGLSDGEPGVRGPNGICFNDMPVHVL